VRPDILDRGSNQASMEFSIGRCRQDFLER